MHWAESWPGTWPTGTAPGAYPVVAFGHGFLQSSSRYIGTLSSIASRGYIVIAPDKKTKTLTIADTTGRKVDDDALEILRAVRIGEVSSDGQSAVRAGPCVGCAAVVGLGSIDVGDRLRREHECECDQQRSD